MYYYNTVVVVILGYDWWLCMVINMISVQYNGWASPRHYTVDPRFSTTIIGEPGYYVEDIAAGRLLRLSSNL